MLLPDPQRRGEIHFVLAKSLPYNRRMLVATVLAAAGFVLQTFPGFLLPGAMLLLAASLFTIVKGYTNRPESMAGKREWRAGEKAQLQTIMDVTRKARTWDQSAIDITCGTGFAVLILTAGAVLGIAFLLGCYGQFRLAQAVVVDSAALLLPHWVTGVRRILTNAPLTVKVENLLYVCNLWELDKKDDEAMAAQIEVMVLTEGKEIPTDAKLILRLPPLGDSFLGMQIQVVLNNVQGADYPYLYCVLVAKSDLKMKSRLSPAPPPEIVTEWDRDQDMDILIIRQMTTKTSGYHTNKTAISTLFSFARAEARKLLAFAPPPLPSST